MTCEQDFLPPLSTRVNVSEYAERLHNSAARYEAWTRGDLVGLVATYQNDPNKECAFISSVSVVKLWQGKGISSRLLEQCIQEVTRLQFAQLALEVNKRQLLAISMYEKRGFKELEATSETIKMQLALNQ